MKIGIANDHRGVNLKKKIMNYLHEKDISCVNYGTNSEESCDYVDYALKLGNAINNKEVDSWNSYLWYWYWYEYCS